MSPSRIRAAASGIRMSARDRRRRDTVVIRSPDVARFPATGRWAAIVLALMLSLTWQSVVTQTHLHAESGVLAASSAAQAAVSVQTVRGPGPSDSPAECPICHEMAQAGHYLSSSAIDPICQRAVIALLLVPLATCATARRRLHPWHSRDPPHVLHD